MGTVHLMRRRRRRGLLRDMPQPGHVRRDHGRHGGRGEGQRSRLCPVRGGLPPSVSDTWTGRPPIPATGVEFQRVVVSARTR
jgi:hypothetical protein